MLSEYIGNSEYVLLNFWASWCAPCLREMPELKAIYDQFHDKGFDIIGISVDEDHEKWIDQLNKTDTPWTNLRNKPENLKDMKDAYLFDSIPHGILIDKQGNVVGIMEIETLRNRLERDLK